MYVCVWSHIHAHTYISILVPKYNPLYQTTAHRRSRKKPNSALPQHCQRKGRQAFGWAYRNPNSSWRATACKRRKPSSTNSRTGCTQECSSHSVARFYLCARQNKLVHVRPVTWFLPEVMSKQDCKPCAVNSSISKARVITQWSLNTLRSHCCTSRGWQCSPESCSNDSHPWPSPRPPAPCPP